MFPSKMPARPWVPLQYKSTRDDVKEVNARLNRKSELISEQFGTLTSMLQEVKVTEKNCTNREQAKNTLNLEI